MLDEPVHPGANMKRLLSIATVTLAAVAFTACGSDDDATSATTSAATSPTAGSSLPAGGSTTSEPGPAADPLTGTQICERLTVDAVAAVTGLDITRATPDDTATPQCAYEYVNSSGGTSNLTVASMRAEDVGGLSGAAAFDFVLQINRSIAGDTDVDEQEISAGDAATRLSGESMHLGVLQVGNQVLTLIVPADDAKSDAVDGLVATMATALG